MWKLIGLAIVGLGGGLAISAGVFAFVISIGVIPRLVGKSNTAQQILLYENMILLGGIVGNIVTLGKIPTPFGYWLLILYGISSGIFTGCLSVALAEILNAFPILFRRTKIKHGLSAIFFAFAIGKSAGSLMYFLMQWHVK
jgi:stage V sporulation protein AB